jgi:predicted acetylornithine/succinylornithine family transaminase
VSAAGPASAGTSHTDAVAREATGYLHAYAPQPLTLVRGEGCRVWDDAGNEYLDLVAGIAVDVLGHAHPRLVESIAKQAATLIQVSNLYYTLPQLELAERLAAASPFDRVFFVNSGTEANEAAIKLARRHGGSRREIVALSGSFHGRTLGSLAATGQPKYQAPFEPLPGGFRHVAPNDLAGLDSAVTEQTSAVLLEPIQGESGVHPLSDEFLLAARAACDAVGALLIFDEVQTGIGRTGTFYAFEQTPVIPDVVTLAKGLAGGVPIGAVLARASADAFQPGDHGTTLGGNPLSCAAGLTTLEVLEEEGLLTNAADRGAQMVAGLGGLPGVSGVRGRGLMVGVETDGPIAKRAVALARERHGLLVNATGDTTLRLVPPLTISPAEVDEAVERLGAALREAAEEAGA